MNLGAGPAESITSCSRRSHHSTIYRCIDHLFALSYWYLHVQEHRRRWDISHSNGAEQVPTKDLFWLKCQPLSLNKRAFKCLRWRNESILTFFFVHKQCRRLVFLFFFRVILSRRWNVVLRLNRKSSINHCYVSLWRRNIALKLLILKSWRKKKRRMQHIQGFNAATASVVAVWSLAYVANISQALEIIQNTSRTINSALPGPAVLWCVTCSHLTPSCVCDLRPLPDKSWSLKSFRLVCASIIPDRWVSFLLSKDWHRVEGWTLPQQRVARFLFFPSQCFR